MKQQTIAVAMFLGILSGLLVDTLQKTIWAPLIYVAEASIENVEPKEVLLEINIDWTEERIKKEIRDVFPDAPIMLEVARCESQYKKDAYNPTNNSDDIGVFQISTKHHGGQVKALGLDMRNPHDNILYAKKLYDSNGLQPWSASKGCWNK